MTLVPQDASWLEHVQAYFLAFRGDGVALSPLDAELLSLWKDEGVPYQVICRGIREAAQARLRSSGPTTRLRTLRSCRTAVEKEFRRYQGLAAGRPKVAKEPKPPTDVAKERAKKAVSLLRKALVFATSRAYRIALQRALEELERVAADPRVVSLLVARADEAIAVAWVRGLPFESRLELVRDARRMAGPPRTGASPRARKDALRAHLVALVRAQPSQGLVALA